MKKNNNNIVPLSIAILAKERGFTQYDTVKSVASLDYYVLPEGVLNGHCLKSKEEISKIKEENINSKVKDFIKDLVYAPTYDELIYWLRTCKFLHIVGIPRVGHNWSYEIYDFGNDIEIYSDKNIFSDYYKMIQIALEKTLKLC